MRTIENDIPEIFLELAREGLSLGLEEVNLGFWYLDADFVSPIEWALHLVKRRSSASDRVRESLVVTAQRNDEQGATAYIMDPEDPSTGIYWSPEEIRSWLREPLEAAGERVPAWIPVEDPAQQEKLLAQWPLFEEGVRSGWTMGRTLYWSELATLRRIAARTGAEPPAEDELPTMSLSWEASNGFYNMKNHPDHRSTGAETSEGGSAVLYSDGDEHFYRHGTSKDPSTFELSREEAEDLLRHNHRWFVRVAAYDEERQEWLHYPEALQGPDETITES